jgi:AcrR family transcriptional regulator
MARRDPAATRQRILDAAIVEFAARGQAGGRIKAIADRAGANPRMIYYYFGSKAGLFLACLGDRSSSASLDQVRLLLWEALESDAAELPSNVEMATLARLLGFTRPASTGGEARLRPLELAVVDDDLRLEVGVEAFDPTLPAEA